MCGRYRLSRRKQLIEEYFETENEVDWEPRYNIAPSQPVGIIRQDPSKAGATFLAGSLGPDSVLGRGRQYRIQDDQCPRGNGRE
jgi:putative SOS response-associated peptidase YedK